MNAKTTRSTLRRVPLLLAAAALWFLPGCGVDETSPSPALPGVPPPAGADLAYQDLTDDSVTSIELTTSVEYDREQNQVRMFALVRDQDGVLVPNLNAHNFAIVLEPKIAPKTVPPEDIELERVVSGDRVVALVVDTSGSMSFGVQGDPPPRRMDVAKDAAKRFVSLMASGDRVALVKFSASANTVQTLTDDRDALNREIERLAPETATNIGGALSEAVRAVGSRPGKRAVILLTDGDDTVDPLNAPTPVGPDVWLNDTTGRSTRLQGLRLAQENELVVYTVGLGSDLSAVGLADLQTIAAATGGTFFQATTAEGLLTAFGQTIPREVDSLPPVETYLLRFENNRTVAPGDPYAVPVTTSVRYRNAIKTHRSVFDGAYTVR
jgi:Mg-chelatase subunit ChlD